MLFPYNEYPGVPVQLEIEKALAQSGNGENA
jgi:hypothetical protein